MNDFVTSTKAAELIGISRSTLIKVLQRHPDLKPARRLEPSGDFLWTEEEITKVAQLRANPNKGGRPRKNKS